MSDNNKVQDENHSFDTEFLEKLIVGIGEVSKITNIPTRQLRYWEDKKIISSLTEEEGKNRRYNYKNIKKILLIKELLDEGYSLDGAVKKIEKRIQMIESSISKIINKQ
ncbi:MerR family transcriptional regulator [Aquimarina aquimarini]|uniref:MerR family transcriptional regulator n=1 Tax=Aquimarina aquimarini TaxID=1191734 RepID=UPI000D551871|nr:MerR family transcriptional regulator [Aquimarina aquimarini]